MSGRYLVQVVAVWMPSFFQSQVIVAVAAYPFPRRDNASPLKNPEGNGLYGRRFIGPAIKFLGRAGQ